MSEQVDQKEFDDYMVASVIRGRSTDIAVGFTFYNLFMIWDWFVSPNNFLILWLIRTVVTTLWLIVVWQHHTGLIQRNLRVIYVGLMFILLNSITLIHGVAFQYKMPPDLSLAAIILPFCMAAFHIPHKDAIFLGGTYVLGFCILIYLSDNPTEIQNNHLLSFLLAYSTGYAGASISERYARRAFLDEKRLREETDRADNLLVSVFPYEVAKELKFNHKSEARHYDHVTVMFCDIVNFTEKSASMPPAKLVDWLNQVFSSFDELVVEHECEKIKTIGDSYMAVCGVPKPTADHAKKIIKLSLALQDKANALFLEGDQVRLRIGISSGPVVAGVIGQSRFAYDLWGDTVNTASRMESLAPISGILVTESTKNLVANTFGFKKVEALPVKGKGIMNAWTVEGTLVTPKTLDTRSVA